MTVNESLLPSGGWSPQTLEGWVELPVLAAPRKVTAELIRTAIKTRERDTVTVLSAGIGRGRLFQELREEISGCALRVVGVDSNPDMLTACQETIGARICSTIEEALSSHSAVTVVGGDLADIQLPEGTIDLAEASFSLHHILSPDRLRTFFQRIARGLAQHGQLIVCDVDLNVGPRIWEKFQRLKGRFSNVWIDYDTGHFVCEDADGKKKKIKLLEPGRSDDWATLEEMKKRSVDGFREEQQLWLPGNQNAIEAVDDNASEMLEKNTEFYRPPEGPGSWRELMEDAFESDDIGVMSSFDLKRIDPRVRDVPIIITATKNDSCIDIPGELP